MFNNRVLQIAFLVSLVSHGVILTASPNFSINLTPLKNKEAVLKVHYVKPGLSKQEFRQEARGQDLKKDPFLNLPSKIVIKEKSPAAFMDKDNIFKGSKEMQNVDLAFNKPTFIKPDIISIKKKIVLSSAAAEVGLEGEKINSIAYISFSQVVREKIKRSLYQNYSGTETGAVTLSFVINKDGNLSDIQINDSKSSANPYLREIALRSVRTASPFPNFPKDLDYPQLSFNVVVSFEIEE